MINRIQRSKSFSNQIQPTAPDEIEKNGKSTVSIGDRPFSIGQKFLSDLEKYSTESVIGKLRKAILIMHSPQDSIVGIENAAEIYKAAHHPKSFI